MRINTICRIAAGIAVGCCLFTLCGCYSLQPAPTASTPAREVGEPLTGGILSVATKGDLALTVDTATGEFQVQNTATGIVWKSNPSETEREADPIAKGNGRALLASAMKIEYQDSLGNISSSASYTASAKKGGVSLYAIQDGFRAVYTFVSEKIHIPLDVQLTETGLHCTVPVKEIREEGENRLLNIHLLPAFGATDTTQEGYFLVPDGSGALIDFNNGRYLYDDFSMPVFGEDISQRQDVIGYTDESALLPVFGIKRSDSGVAAIISEGAAGASVEAVVSGKSTSYNMVNASFALRDTEDYTLGTSVGRTKEVRIFQEEDSGFSMIGVTFLLLEAERSDYVGMAAACRNWMLQNGWLADERTDALPLYVRFLAGVLKEKSVMGIPMKQVEKLTGFDEAEDILQQLSEKDVRDLLVYMEGWSEQFLQGKIDVSAKPAAVLGGTKQLQALNTYCRDNGIALYLDGEFQKAAKWSGGYNSFQHAARMVSGVPATVTQFDIVSRAALDETTENLLSPAIFGSVFGRYLPALEKIAGTTVGIGVGSAANSLFGDHANGYSREQSVMVIQDLLKQATDAGHGVAGYGSNAYMWPYSEAVLALPMTSNSFNITDRSVPFLQIVLKGYLPYSTPSINQSEDTQAAFLKAMESGSGLLFTWIAADAQTTRETRYAAYNSASAADWLETAALYQKQLAKLAEAVGDSTIIGHTRRDDVSVTTYENGTAVYVNHGDTDAVYDGMTIPANDYLLASSQNSGKDDRFE